LSRKRQPNEKFQRADVVAKRRICLPVDITMSHGKHTHQKHYAAVLRATWFGFQQSRSKILVR